jgi:hypothetical protein
MAGAHTRTLERALEVVRTRERLAVILDVSLHDLEAYLSGAKPLPTRAYITALDIVANNGKPKQASSWRNAR